MDADDRKLFEESLRRIAEGSRADDGARGSFDGALDELGWSDAYADEPRLAVSLLFEQLGAVNATSDALGQVIAATAGFERRPGVAVVLPAAGGFAAPGTVSADGCVIDGLVTNSTADADVFAVIADDINDYRVVLVGRGEIELEPRHGIDPAFGVVAIRASRPATVTGSVTAVDWPAAVAAAQVALSHQLLGAAGAMLRMARDHAVGRVQFDRPISGFQAVRHRLADALVAMRAAEAATAAAWAAPSPTASIFAKALAGRAARTTAGHAQQVLGAMGFTDEHPLHRYVRRVLVLDDQFGSSRALIEQIGAEALRQRRLPDMVPLWAQP